MDKQVRAHLGRYAIARLHEGQRARFLAIAQREYATNPAYWDAKGWDVLRDRFWGEIIETH